MCANLSIFVRSEQRVAAGAVVADGDGDRDGTVAAQLDQRIARETVEQRRLFAR